MSSRQIDDRKPAKPEPERSGNEVALVIGPAMRDRVRHAHDRLALHRLVALEVKLAELCRTCSDD